MGVIFGIINIIVAIWFFSSAASVKKQTLMWAVIGALSFLAFKFLGYSIIGMLQGSIDQSNLGDLTAQGYVATERSAAALSSETFDDQSMILGIFYEFFPLILALLAVSFIRGKFILEMGFIDSLKHKTPLKIVSTESNGESSSESTRFLESITNLWKKK